jgi:hypothetical protein
MDTSSDGGTDSLQECDERTRIVRDELPAVTRGSFPSLDYVHCPVPGCKFSTGKGLLRNSLANHWAAAGNVETHSCYELVVPDINKGKRKSAEQARNQKAKQRALMHTFFLPSAAQAAAAAAAVPAPSVVAGNAACQPSGVGAQPVTGAVADTGAGAGAAAPVDSAGETSLPSLSGSPRASESDEDAPEDGSDEYAGVDADIWTTPAFYEGIEDLMYLINHLWLKSKCEAVVEGMGGIVSLHGDKSRGRLRQELTEIEALVHYNFPPLASRACEVLIEEVLNHYFTGPDGKQKPWHFEHANADQGRRALFARRSKVMRRHDEAEVKHAFLGCDV